MTLAEVVNRPHINLRANPSEERSSDDARESREWWRRIPAQSAGPHDVPHWRGSDRRRRSDSELGGDISPYSFAPNQEQSWFLKAPPDPTSTPATQATSTTYQTLATLHSAVGWEVVRCSGLPKKLRSGGTVPTPARNGASQQAACCSPDANEFHRQALAQGAQFSNHWPIINTQAPVVERPIALPPVGEGAANVAHGIRRNTCRSNLFRRVCVYDAAWQVTCCFRL